MKCKQKLSGQNWDKKRCDSLHTCDLYVFNTKPRKRTLIIASGSYLIITVPIAGHIRQNFFCAIFFSLYPVIPIKF